MLIEFDLEKARHEILKKANSTEAEDVDILDGLGRVTYEDILSPMDVPCFDRSPFDGYAVKLAEISGLKEGETPLLKVIGNIPAGNTFSGGNGEKMTAVRVMTGAPVPMEYDLVVKKEDTDEGKEFVKIFRISEGKRSIQKRGDDIKIGENLVKKGTLINSRHIGALASVGISKIKVYKKPKVAVISTGSELALPGQELKAGKIYNSNLYGITSGVVEIGCNIVMMECVEDRADLIISLIRKAVDISDVVITTGGVSVGDYDLIASSLESLGAHIIYERLIVPAIIAELDGKVIFGLSGNPLAAFMSFDIITKSFIKKVGGRMEFQPIRTKGYLKEDLFYKGKDRRYLRSTAEIEDGRYLITAGSIPRKGKLSSMIRGNVYIDLPNGVGEIKAGEEVDIILIDS